MLTVKSPERSPERLTRKTILAPTGTSGFPGLSTASTVIVGRALDLPLGVDRPTRQQGQRQDDERAQGEGGKQFNWGAPARPGHGAPPLQ